MTAMTTTSDAAYRRSLTKLRRLASGADASLLAEWLAADTLHDTDRARAARGAIDREVTVTTDNGQHVTPDDDDLWHYAQRTAAWEDAIIDHAVLSASTGGGDYVANILRYIPIAHQVGEDVMLASVDRLIADGLLVSTDAADQPVTHVAASEDGWGYTLSRDGVAQLVARRVSART